MAVKVAVATSLHVSQPIVPHFPSYSETLASAIGSTSSRRRCLHVRMLDRSFLFGTPLTKLHRTRFCQYPKPRNRSIERSCSASLDAFSDEEMFEKIQELALKFQFSAGDDGADNCSETDSMESETAESVSDSMDNFDILCDKLSDINSGFNLVQSHGLPSEIISIGQPWLEIPQEPPDWAGRGEIIPASIERKANSVELPLSLRIIKRKMQWQESIKEAGESACCSVKKAFSSMVFMIRELHTYSLQLRELLFYEDLQGIVIHVQKEMHASFVWLFQQVFSHTPTLMVYVMILLANFTVFSVGHNTAIAASPAPGSYSAASQMAEIQDASHKKFDSLSVKKFSVSSSGGKTTSIGGNNGGGGNIPPVASGTDGDGWSDRTDDYQTIIPDGTSQFSPFGTGETESVSGEETEEEVTLWNSVLDEASKMQAAGTDEALDDDTIRSFVSPVTSNIEADDYTEYFRTELLYQSWLAQDPNNPLLLSNYAQFLYLVGRNYDRAEEYFKRAVGVEPADAEAYNRYANFLWRAKKDMWAAEEAFLEAINADPGNAYYAANYAHFLWNTGGEETCFPLPSPEA